MIVVGINHWQRWLMTAPEINMTGVEMNMTGVKMNMIGEMNMTGEMNLVVGEMNMMGGGDESEQESNQNQWEVDRAGT